MHEAVSLTTDETELLPEEKKRLGQLAEAFIFQIDKTATRIDLLLAAPDWPSASTLELALPDEFNTSEELSGRTGPDHDNSKGQNTPDIEHELSPYWYWVKL